jgi:hypothetical protein
LHGLPGRALPQIIEARNDNEALPIGIQNEADIAEIRFRDVLQFGQ